MPVARLFTITPTPGPAKGYGVEIPDELYEALLVALQRGLSVSDDPGDRDTDDDGDGHVNIDPAILASVFDHALHESGIASLIGDPDVFLDTLVAETLGYEDVDDLPTVTDARIILDRALDVYSDADGDGHADLPYFDDALVDAFWNAVLGSGIVHDS